MAKWLVKTIGELCDAAGGVVKTGPFGAQLHQSDYSEEGTPVVMPTDIINGRIDISRIARVADSHVERLKAHKLRYGDIVYGRRGDIGRQALIRQENIGWLCGTGCLKISLGKAQVLPEYLHYYLSIQEVIGWIQGQAIGATMPNLNTAILRRVPIRFPESQKTQSKIISIISAYDDLIENNKRRIAILEKMAEEIYREWFVRMRFSSYAKATEDKPAQIQHQGLPAGWSFSLISDAIKYTGGGTPSTMNAEYWNDGNVNWFTPTDVTGTEGLFLAESSEKCTEAGVRHSSATMFPPYSLMMTSRATIGAIAINTQPACTNQGFITCIPNERYTLPYLYHWLKLNKSYFEQISSGATFLELIKSRFKKVQILTPPQSVMVRYTELSKPLFDQMETLLAANALLKKTRDLLLPRLISGKLSVENLELPSNEQLASVSSALPQQELAHA